VDLVAANGRRLCYAVSLALLGIGRRRCYKRLPALLHTVVGSATHAHHRCYRRRRRCYRRRRRCYRRRRRCYTRSPALLHTSAVSATNARPHPPLVLTAANPPPALSAANRRRPALSHRRRHCACCCKRLRLQQVDMVGATSRATLGRGHGSRRSSTGLRWGDVHGRRKDESCAELLIIRVRKEERLGKEKVKRKR
jgi:hypothetical protein